MWLPGFPLARTLAMPLPWLPGFLPLSPQPCNPFALVTSPELRLRHCWPPHVMVHARRLVGRMIASGCDDGTFRIEDRRSFRVCLLPEHIFLLVFVNGWICMHHWSSVAKNGASVFFGHPKKWKNMFICQKKNVQKFNGFYWWSVCGAPDVPSCGFVFCFCSFNRYLMRLLIFSSGFVADMGNVWTTSRLSRVRYLLLSIFIQWPWLHQVVNWRDKKIERGPLASTNRRLVHRDYNRWF